MSKVVVAIKPPSSSKGSSGVTRYIAESKRDPEKEALEDKEPRPLFSESEERLTYIEANELLAQSTGALAEKEDVIHIIISPEKGEFEKLGDTPEERIEAFKEIIREAAREIETEVNVVELHWVAGIHLNTDIPHAHMAISRDGWDRTTEEAKHIEHLPRTLLPHNIKDEQGEKTFVPGKIATTVSNGIERQQRLVRERHPEIQTREQAPDANRLPDHETPQQLTTDHEAPGQLVTPDDGHQQPVPAEISQGIDQNNRVTETPEISTVARENGSPEQPEPPPPSELHGQDRTRENSVEPLANPTAQHEEAVPHSLSPDPTDTQPLSLDVQTETNLESPQETRVPLHEASSAAETLEGPTNHSDHALENQSEQLPGRTDPTADPNWRDRYVLGRSMVARGEVDRLEADLKSTREHGDKRRFRVYDATHGHTRQISEFDMRRRADASATSAVRQTAIVNPDGRQQARQSHYDSEINRHEKGIGDHQIIVAKTIAKIESHLATARTQHAELKPLVHQIQQHYKANGQPLPVPLLTPAELTKLQDQAIAARNPARVRVLENIRDSLAAERGDHSRDRTDKEIARLDGQLLTARSEQAARQERVHQFERTRHQTRWEIDGEKYSLADLDRRISEQENRSRLFGSTLKITTLHLRPSSRREAAIQVKELQEVREIVVTKIDERRQELAGALKESSQMTSVLSEIHTREQTNLFARGGERQEKVLTRSEINQLIDHGNTLSDPAMLSQAFILETRFEENQLADDKKPSLTEKAARAIGREALSEIALRQVTDRLSAFTDRKQFTPVAIKDREGKEQTRHLFDFRHARHPLAWLAERITESKDHRHSRNETTKAVEAEHARLKDDVTKASQCHELTKALGDSHREQLFSTGQPIPDATFTPKQIIQLEIYGTRHQDPTERLRVETLVNRAEVAPQTHNKQPELNIQPNQSPSQSHSQPAIPPQSHSDAHLLPGDHMHHGEQLRNDHFSHPAGQQAPGALKVDPYQLPEQHPSQSHLQPGDQPQPGGASAQVNAPDLTQEAPDLDLTI